MVISEKLKYEEVTGYKFGRTLVGQPKMCAYIYFVDGLLIDTGQRFLRKEVRTVTKQLPIKQIFITHHHEDHTGNIIPIQQQHQCKVFGSDACSKLMKAPPRLSFAQQFTWGNREPFAEIIPIKDHVTTPKHTFQLIPIPGHAPDMVALYEPEKHWLFSADLYINSYIGYFLDSESVAQQIASTRKILTLDFKVLFCNHNPQLKNAKQQLVKKLDFLETSFEEVARLHGKGLTAKAIFKELKWQENWFVSILSGGQLSKQNMVKSIVRDLENG
ncbi:MAG: MBL fold metallo-hydrolase [Bacteroidota bacterium]